MKRKYTTIITTTILLIIILYVVLSYIQESEPASYKIGYQPTAFYLPLFVAVERGFFSELGIDVEPIRFQSANHMMQGLLTGEIVGTGISSLIVLATVEHEDPGHFKMYLFQEITQQNYPDMMLVRRDSPIKSLEELKGKRLGVFPGSTIRSYSKIILRNFMDPSREVEMIQLAPQLQVQALESGQIDALFTLEPLGTIAVEKGIAKILDKGLLARYIMEPLLAASAVFSVEFLTESPEDAKKIRDGMYKAVDYIRENPFDARNALPTYTPIDSTIAQKIRLVSWKKLSEVNKVDVDSLLNIYYEEGILSDKVTFENAYLREQDLM